MSRSQGRSVCQEVGETHHLDEPFPCLAARLLFSQAGDHTTDRSWWKFFALGLCSRALGSPFKSWPRSSLNVNADAG